MEYLDRVYGKNEIDEPVVLELIASPAMQRLKEIDQAGYFHPFFPGTQHTRFEHSLGVYLLLKKYGAPLAEQIAGLIHDVSHSAFSHCIDYVLAGGSETEQSHQDNAQSAFVRKSEIPGILAKFGIDTDYILDDNNFPLKEKNLPDLCADRLDYSFRTAMLYAKKSPEEIAYLLEHLKAEQGQWFFTDFASARRYAELFRELNEVYYAGLPSATMFRTVGDYLKHAIGQGYIESGDLYTTDARVIAKINRHLQKDPRLELLWERMNNRVGAKNNPDEYDAEVSCKSRIVDPLCRHAGELRRVSEVAPDWRKVVAQESKPKHYRIKFSK